MRHKLHVLAAPLCIALLLFTGSCKKSTDAAPADDKGSSSSLLSSPQKGKPFSSGIITDFTLANNNNSVVLLAVNDVTGSIYAIDLEDNKASDAAANTISGSVNTFCTDICAKLGMDAANFAILNMEVNPISKSVYVLVGNTLNNTTTLVKAENAGATLTVVNLADVSYSAIKFSNNGERVNDITWGDNKLYISFSNSTSLNGSIGTASAPFQNGSAVTTRATSVFKTNWGGNYFTNAPLESMVYAEVSGEKRLMGVTVCAPGYSFKTSDISGSGVLQVNEYFNLNTGFAVKVFPVTISNKTFLVELHQTGKLRRIGEKHIDGSQSVATSGQARFLLQDPDTVASGMTDDDIRLVSASGIYIAAAGYSGGNALVVDSSGRLSLLAM